MPKTKYIACVCVKGLIPKKEQCVIFSTDEAASASGTQKLINVVVISVACVIAVPLTLIVCCGALKRRLQKLMGRKSKDIQDSYVTFETLSPGSKAKELERDYLSRLNPDESKPAALGPLQRGLHGHGQNRGPAQRVLLLTDLFQTTLCLAHSWHGLDYIFNVFERFSTYQLCPFSALKGYKPP